MSAQRFKVDVGGLVTLLSSSLYSGTSVYVRELLQNAVDAITARRELDPNAPAQVRIEPWEDGSGITVRDTGIGLTAEQAEDFLATIGRTSKRDEVFGEGRAEFLGQFGIGMLACFLVADQVEVVSRSALPDAVPVRWLGSTDGTFSVEALSEAESADFPVGTEFRLRARSDALHWVDESTVVALALDYGSLLPLDIAVKVSVGRSSQGMSVSSSQGQPTPSPSSHPSTFSSNSGTGTRMWRRITESDLPWERSYNSAAQRREALNAYAQETLGFTPLAVIDLNVPMVGLSGVAFVLPQAVAPGSGRHRVYVKRMLVGPREDSILPEWAFFVRAVINADALAPTASREQLRNDEMLLLTREELGKQLTDWIVKTVEEGGATARSFVETHHLALRAIALESDTMLDVVAKALPFETTMGIATLNELAQDGVVHFASTTESYRRIAPVARAQGVQIVNAGYVYDADLLARLADRPGWKVNEISASDITQVMSEVSSQRLSQTQDALEAARTVLEKEQCEVLLRSFDPQEVPAVLLRDTEAERRRQFEKEREASQGLWGGLLDSFIEENNTYTRTLVLNDSNQTAQKLLQAPSSQAFEAGVRSLYLSAVMLAGEGLSPTESRDLNDSLNVLLSAALS